MLSALPPPWPAVADAYLTETHLRGGSVRTAVEYARILGRFFAGFSNPAEVTPISVHSFAYGRSPGRSAPAASTIEDVLARITSPASRQFLREVAARALADEALPIDDALRARCGLPPGRTFVGVLGVANRTMRRRAGRELVSWDREAGGYRVSRDDARIILDTLGPPTAGAATPRQAAEPRGASPSSR